MELSRPPHKRSRGRPTRGGGVKAPLTATSLLNLDLPAVMELLEQRRCGKRDALRYVATKHGLSPRTLERRLLQHRTLAVALLDSFGWTPSQRRVVSRFIEAEVRAGRGDEPLDLNRAPVLHRR